MPELWCMVEVEMKTLDEVIDIMEHPLYGADDGFVEIAEDDIADALHYLKAFRDAKDALDAERERTIDAYCQWKDAKEKLEAQTIQMMWVDKHFQFEISDNPPLDWETLKTMEGKPVWIYCLSSYKEGIPSSWTGWEVIQSFAKGWMKTTALNRWHKDDLGKTWQAYRKERE